jgi:DNA-binding response OmpR family regulator
VARVVVIEDEEPIAAAVAARLRSEGFLILDHDDSGHTRRIRKARRRALSDDVEISRRSPSI